MKYQDHPVFSTPPSVCGFTAGDCPAHGFGLSKERGNELIRAIYDHGDTCRDEETATVDYARFMAGPSSLDLTTPAEVLFVGYYMSRVSTGLQEWQAQATQQLVLHELRTTLAGQSARDGGSSPFFNFGQSGPDTD